MYSEVTPYILTDVFSWTKILSLTSDSLERSSLNGMKSVSWGPAQMLWSDQLLILSSHNLSGAVYFWNLRKRVV